MAVGADVDEAASSSNRSGAAVEVTAGAAQSSSGAAAAAAAAANGATPVALPNVLAADWTVPVPAPTGANENTSYDFSLKVLSVMSVIRAEERGAARRREQKLLREIAELKSRLDSGGGGAAGEGEEDEEDEDMVVQDASSQAQLLAAVEPLDSDADSEAEAESEADAVVPLPGAQLVHIDYVQHTMTFRNLRSGGGFSQEECEVPATAGAADGIGGGKGVLSMGESAAKRPVAKKRRRVVLKPEQWTRPPESAEEADHARSSFPPKYYTVAAVKNKKPLTPLRIALALNPAGALHAALAHDSNVVGGLGSRKAERMRAEKAASAFDLKLNTLMAGLNELYAVCDAHNPCAMPRCMQRTVSVLMDNPAVRYADDCDNCTGCDRKKQAEEAVAAAAAAVGPPPAKRRKSRKRGTAYSEHGTLKGGPQALAAMEDAVRTRVAGEIAPTFDALKLGVFKETGLNAKTVEHWLRMVLCARLHIKDEPPPLVGSQKPGKWRVLPIDVVTPGRWCTVGGVLISLHHEKWGDEVEVEMDSSL